MNWRKLPVVTFQIDKSLLEESGKPRPTVETNDQNEIQYFAIKQKHFLKTHLFVLIG